MMVPAAYFKRNRRIILGAVFSLLFVLQLEIFSLERSQRWISREELVPESSSSEGTEAFSMKNRKISNISHNVQRIPALDDHAMITAHPEESDLMSISDMRSMLLKNRAILASSRPRWSAAPDREILYARRQIENAPMAENDDEELHAPAYWNLSTFKRSYELMEKTLRVFVYEEGERPIFHEPVLEGIYASEGWFMKLMREDSRFVVDDPRRAHLFYMPFSSAVLRFSSYVPGPHGKRQLLQYLHGYVRNISAKYPFWNRTGGADHFFVACHDWAPYLTRRTMARCIRVLCNSDASEGFLLGKDVSLPQANVLNPRDPYAVAPPLRHRPSDPPRRFLAFYAGRMHGYLRPLLVRHWLNRDPAMKILGRLVCGARCRRTYSRFMRRSKFCVCPRGFQAYSPRVVEAILHGCVPVILSDRYVPPFFEVLDWSALAVVVPERDISRLKDILSSISGDRYRAMRVAVEGVRRHFLWQAKPTRYDLFHMVLHSVWLNRLSLMAPAG